jgi:outer membrane biosynthesis protein TonB
VAGRPLLFRFLALAAFLVTVALGLWLAEVRPLFVGIVMAVALLAAWLVEWLAWRGESAPVQAAPVAPAAPPAPDIPEPEAPAAKPRWQTEEAAPREQAVAEPQPLAPVEPQVPEDAEAPVPAEPEPPPREPLRPVPSLPPEPAPPPAPSAPPAAAAPAETGASVVPLPWRPSPHAQEWNLWDLERIAREDTKRDPQRRAELSALFLHLRQFATADGTLPREFDPLLRESFGGLLERTRRA